MESLQKLKSQLDTLQILVVKIDETSQFGNIEKDILLAKLREMYETILNTEIILQKPAAIKEEPLPVVETTIVEDISDVEFDAEMVKENPIELNEPLPTHKPQKQYDDILIRIDDVHHDEKPEVKTIEPPIVEPPQIVIPESPKQPEPKAKEIEPQIVEPVHAGESLAAKLSHTKIPNIAAGLSFSDRLMFQKQLFKDRSEEFARTISDLDDLESFEEAVAWLQATYSWNFENPIVKKFLEIVQRRY